ncbi:MAG TPA: DNA primase, partial [Holosporales bacterium]|nr:DNA primase [Holosporales bacterium]
MLLYQVSSNMVTFSSGFLDQIRQRISLADVIGRYTTVQKRGSNLIACCPFHKEKSPSFYIYEEDGHYHCYGCKAHGDIFSFLMEKRGFSFPEVVEDLAGQAGLQIPQNGGDSEEDRRAKAERGLFYEIMEKTAQFYEKQLLSNGGSSAKKYTDNRGITLPTQKTFRLGYAPRGNVLHHHLSKLGYKTPALQKLGLVQESKDRPGDFYDYFRDRLMFPIWDKRGRVIAFGGRILGTGHPKYINSPETPLFHKGDVIYGYHLAKQAKAQNKLTPLICSEGYMDVVALHQGGFQGAVAPNGTSITENQLDLLWKLDHEPIICLDGDKAGEEAALRALKVALPFLEAGKTLRFVSLPSGEDPDSLLRAGKKELL